MIIHFINNKSIHGFVYFIFVYNLCSWIISENDRLGVFFCLIITKKPIFMFNQSLCL